MPVGCVFPSPGGGGHFTTTGDKEVQPDAGYRAFVSRGSVSGGGVTRPVNILRDSGALQTLLRAGMTTGEEIGEWVILSSIGGRNSAPLVRIHLDSDCFQGEAPVAALPELPVQGVDIILGNDLAGERMGGTPPPVLQEEPSAVADLKQLEANMPQVFPFCAVTRTMSTRAQTPESPVPQSSTQGDEAVDLDLSSLFAEPLSAGPCLSSDKMRQGREALITAQREDESLMTMMEQALT